MSLRPRFVCLCLILAASPLLAASHNVEYDAGPTSMVMGVNQFAAFHAMLANGGDAADSFNLTITPVSQPANWTFGVCYGGVCYPPGQFEFTMPADGTLAPGEAMSLDLDVTTLQDAGAADWILTFRSNNDPDEVHTVMYSVYTPTEPVALEYVAGNAVVSADLNNVVSIHTVLYNAGTTDDTYTLSVIRDLPANWTATYCYDGVCYTPDASGGPIPDGPGVIASGQAVPIDLDFTTLLDEGSGSITVNLVSNTDGSVAATRTFHVTTGGLEDIVDFDYHSGTTEMVMGVNQFGQFHSSLTNTGTVNDSYTMAIVSDLPANWTVGNCYDGVCYPPTQTVFTVPADGNLAPGETMDFDLDVTTLMDAGAGSFDVQIYSNSNGELMGHWTYEIFTPSEPLALLLAHDNAGVVGASVNEFVQTHAVLYNAGTQDDTYTLTIERNLPTNWTASFCYGGVCYPPTVDSSQIPDGGGTVASGQAVPIDIDFTTLLDTGTGSAIIRIHSNTDPTLAATAAWTVTTGSIVAVENVPALDLLSGLHAAPNPFNPRTDIRFSVGGSATTSALVDIHDVSGRRVRTIHTGMLAPGAQSLSWDGRGDNGNAVAAGVYLARVRVGDDQQIVKLSLVK